ncbi:hypothetical protein Lgra_2963 [Legionella gratiana]|uniref:Uncharacterized protein n=1 Tax=Legionella gratiana TaxID=45066 RepID=A0A378J6G9_9GAMM|nr:hypothetical protein [Legionella gratiana]KTD06186.1 hypothetical protein Lgra_2963 [Legionella gratiana]STX43039.1 Uncharacterised protein [Legionella gratiana]
MLRFMGFFAQPAKTAIQTGACAVATTVLASGAYQAGTVVKDKVKEKYQQLQCNEPHQNDCYFPKIGFNISP